MLEEEEDTTVLLDSWGDAAAEDDNLEQFGQSELQQSAVVCWKWRISTSISLFKVMYSKVWLKLITTHCKEQLFSIVFTVYLHPPSG